MLRPLARVLIRHGLTSYDLSRIANIAFVQAARDILLERGESASFSRIAAITGLHRHVVSEIVRSADNSAGNLGLEKDYRRNRIARVLAGWFESPEYTDKSGRPLPLSIDGPRPSFAALVRAYSGDIYPQIILDELLQVGAVRVRKDGAVRVVTRRYTLGGADPSAISNMGMAAGDLLRTLEYNLSASPESRHFVDSVSSESVSRAALPLLRHLLRQRGAAFLNDVEGWVAENENQSGQETVRAGVLIQMYVDEMPPPRSPAPGKRKRRR